LSNFQNIQEIAAAGAKKHLQMLQQRIMNVSALVRYSPIFWRFLPCNYMVGSLTRPFFWLTENIVN